MSKEHEEMFELRRYTAGKQTHEEIFNISCQQGNANSNYNEISLHIYQNGFTKIMIIPSVNKDEEELNHSYIAQMHQNKF